MSVGGPGEVLVSSSLHDVVAGSTLAFVDHGVHRLKGIEGEWRLFAVTEVEGVELARPLDAAEAARIRFAIEPGTKKRQRRTALLVGGVLAAVLVAGVLLVALTRDGTEAAAPTSDPPAPNSVARLDLQTGEIEIVNDRVAQNLAPQFDNDDLEIGEGSVWLLRGNALNRVDPTDASTTRLAQSSGFGIRGIDVGLGSVWSVALELSRVNHGTGVIERTYPVGSDPLVNGPADVVVGFDRVWVSTVDGRLVRVDPNTDHVTRYRIGGTPERLASGTDAIWAIDEFDGQVLRFDPASETVTDRVELSGGLDAIAAGEGYAWVLDSERGTLTPISEGDAEPLNPIDVGTDAAEDVTVGRGSVWVAAGGSILEINPATRQIVRTIEVAPTPIIELAVDPASGALWVSMAGGDLQTD